MSQLRVVVGTTHIKVYLNKDTPRPVFWTLEKFCDKKLRLWEKNFRTKKWEPTVKYYVILPNREGISIPITFKDELYSWLGENDLTYNVEQAIIPEPKSLAVILTPGWSPREYQQIAVDYLTNVDLPRHGLNAECGDGKTCMSIFTFHKLDVIPLIVLPGQVIEQWPDRLKDQLQITDDDIYLIKGYDSLEKLWKNRPNPKVIIASISTMKPYIQRKDKYAALPPYHTLIEKFGIGVKISDEAHMHFHTNVLLDLSANVKYNIYLTATFKTGNNNLKRIFDKIYPDGMRYVPRERESYTHITEYGYAGNVPNNRCMTNRGYSHAKYEQHLMKRDLLYNDWLNRVLYPIFRSHYIQKSVPREFKCVIFCRTIEFINRVVNDLQKSHPDLTVRGFTTGDPDSVLEDAQVIVSTFGSCGTGKDIKNLFTVINTVSFKAPTLTLQVIGRLRELSGYNPEYAEAFDINIAACLTHWRERAKVYKTIGKTYSEYRIR